MIDHIFAINALTANAYYPLFAFYALLTLFMLLGGWRSRNRVQQVQLIWFAVLPWILFGGLWSCGRLLWVIFWWLRLGDDGRYEQYARWSAIGVALCVSALVFARLVTGYVSRKYLISALVGALILVASMSCLAVWDVSQHIYGWSARGAAENEFSRVPVNNHPFIKPLAARRVVEEKSAGRPESTRQFVLYYGEVPISEVSVAPYGWFWWTFAGSRSLHFEWAESKWRSDPDAVTKTLEDFMRNNPTGADATIAKEMLDQLRNQTDGNSP